MGLRLPGLIFRAEVASTLVITPRANEGFIIRKVFVTNPSPATQFATLITDTARVGFFRTAGLGGRHLIAPNETARGANLLDFLTRNFAFPGYPVEQGVAFTVSLDTGTADIFVQADAYDAADIKPDSPNGSKSAQITFLNYGTNLAAISVSGYNKLDSSRNPAEMMRFPFGAVGAGLVPAARRVQLLILGGQGVGRFVSGGNTASTQYLRVKRGSPPYETLLDRADVGYPFIGTTPGAGVDYTGARQVLPSSEAFTAQRDLTPDDVINPLLEFGPNDELALQAQTTIVGTGSLSIGDIDVWCAVRVLPV